MRNVYSATLLSCICVLSGCSLESRPQIAAGGNALCVLTNSCDGSVGAEAAGKAGVSGGGALGGRAANPADAGPRTDANMSLPDGATNMDIEAQAAALHMAGESCAADAECLSGHCDGVCCASGDCCLTVSDCKVAAIPLACNDPATCSGSGGTLQCNKEFRCVALGGDPNDTMCDSLVEANNCGPYPSAFCNGTIDQKPPSCATSCKSDSQCDANAHCDGNKACVPDIANGGLCGKNSDCASGHCMNDVCCASGDCCLTALTCPDTYRAAPTCDMPARCEGNRKDATCVRSQCGSMLVGDDSACGVDTVLNDCGLYASATCTGRSVQGVPQCSTACTQDSQCDSNAYCKKAGSATSGTCATKQVDGASCSSPNQCTNGACANGFCCADSNATCCNTDTDCAAPATVCDSLMTCQGKTYAAVCSAAKTCKVTSTMSPAPCMDMKHSCSTGYNDVLCPKMCPSDCSPANAPVNCAPNYDCVSMKCVPRAGSGGGNAAGAGGSGGAGGAGGG
jgi:hypothetical protein